MKFDNAPQPQVTERQFYQSVVRLLTASKLPFLVGGAHALKIYTGIERWTKDFDVFVKKDDVLGALAIMQAAGYRTEMTDQGWIAKAFSDGMFVDFIFAFGNGIATVDDTWFASAKAGEVFGLPVQFVSPEEMLWSKAYVMDRDRFDGADIAHIILRCGKQLDWQRISRRFSAHLSLLLIYLIYFDLIYPGQRTCVPDWLCNALMAQLASQPQEPAAEHACLGTLFSRSQYQIDLECWGFFDTRARADNPEGCRHLPVDTQPWGNTPRWNS